MSTMTATTKQAAKPSNEKSKLVQSVNAIRTPVVRNPDPVDLVQRIRMNPDSLTRDDVIHLQNIIGNKAVMKLLSEVKSNKGTQNEGKAVPPKGEKAENPQQAGGAKPVQRKVSDETQIKQETAKPEPKAVVSAPVQMKENKPEAQPKKAEAASAQKESTPPAGKKETPAPAGEGKKLAKDPEVVAMVNSVLGEKPKSGSKETSPAAPTAPSNKKAEAKAEAKVEAAPQKEAKAPAAVKGKGDKAGGGQKEAAPVAEAAGPGGIGGGKKPAAKPVTVKINGGDPGQVMEQLANVPPAAVMDAFSQAVAVSGGALEKQRQKTQQVIPTIPAPTGLAPTKTAGKEGKKAETVNHAAPEGFKSEKSGGKAYEGMPPEFSAGSGGEEDPDAIMAEARAFSGQAPQISMEGEADPSQAAGFKNESDQSVQAAKQAELAQTNNDFGEKNIFPKPDNTVLKAEKGIQAVTPPAPEMVDIIPVGQDIAAQVNQPLAPMLKSKLEAKKNEYQKGKAKYDTDVIAAKAEADSSIEQKKAEAKEKQVAEQAGAQAEVNNLRGQWKNEINGAVSEYDKQASSATQDKQREIGNVKEQKEGEVKKELANAEKDARKESKEAKNKADDKRKEGEKEKSGGGFWGWIKEKAQKFIDGIKNAINSIFDGLRKAVKFIFDKAKQAAMAIIETGRKMIVGLIKGLGEVLKTLVKAAFAKFPGIANKICGMIDKAVNKAIEGVNAAADLLKKGVTAALGLLASTLDGLFSVVQSIYNGILDGVGKILKGEFKDILLKALEAAQIAAEIAAAFATGGGSILLQIGMWLVKTLPELFQTVSSVLGFVNTIRSINFDDIKQLIHPGKIGEFLVKGLFGELPGLPVPEGGDKDNDKDEEPAGGGEAKGLMKVFQVLSGVFKVLKKVYGKVAGAINKVLPIINLPAKPWFEMFSMIYAGAVKAMSVVQDPAGGLNDGVGKLKEAVGEFFTNIKSKVVETARAIKEKIAIIGHPGQLMKLLANKAVDMVLNFIITHPPSALIKVAFKAIEAASGKSIVELVRQYIPFADKLINKIAESGPVQGLLKPLEPPIQSVGGAIDNVSGKAVGMVDDAEQKTVSTFGSGAKILTGLAGVSGGGKKGGEGGAGGGGDFLGAIKSGVHSRLMALGSAALLKKGAGILKTVGGKAINKIKGMILGRKVGFKVGSESHELWVEKQGSRVEVIMASTPEKFRKRIEEFKKELANIGNSLDKAKRNEIAGLIAKLEEITGRLELSENQKEGDREQLLVEGTNYIAKLKKALPGVNDIRAVSKEKLEELCESLKEKRDLSRDMIKEFKEGIKSGKFTIKEVPHPTAKYKVDVLDADGKVLTTVLLDAKGNTVRMTWTVDKKGKRGTGYRRADVGATEFEGEDGKTKSIKNERGHIKSVNEGAQDNAIEDSPINIIPQTPAVNDPKIKAFETFRVKRCQGDKVITDILENPKGYVRVRIPAKDIDVTYNPVSTKTKDWPKDWFMKKGKVFN